MSDFILRYAVTLAALGALTMAVQEAVKKVLGLLSKFHRKALQAWLEVDGGSTKKHYQVSAIRTDRAEAAIPPRGRQPAFGSNAYEELLHLTTGLALDETRRTSPLGSTRHVANALFELELAQMMSQIQDAADAALSNPERYPALYAFLTRGCAIDDAERWASAMSSTKVAADGTDPKELGDLYGRIRLLVKRQLDSFQTVTTYRWREWNQMSAVLLGAALMFIAQLRMAGGQPSYDWVGMVLVSVLGGMLAPVAKDLVDALGSMKTK
jgi:hypothetical protein